MSADEGFKLFVDNGDLLLHQQNFETDPQVGKLELDTTNAATADNARGEELTVTDDNNVSCAGLQDHNLDQEIAYKLSIP